MAKDDGGPAFPFTRQDVKGYTYEYSGMSLRDYATVHVIAGLVANPNFVNIDRADHIPTVAETIVTEFLKRRYD